VQLVSCGKESGDKILPANQLSQILCWKFLNFKFFCLDWSLKERDFCVQRILYVFFLRFTILKKEHGKTGYFEDRVSISS
jgi:hypothetical protein